MVYLACQHAIKMIVMWYDGVVSSFEWYKWLDLAHVHACSWNKISIAFMIFMFMVDYILLMLGLYPTHAYILLTLSSWSLPSFLLAFTCTEREYCLCIQSHKPQKLFHMSPPYLPICSIYLPFQVNLYVPNSKPSNKHSVLYARIAHVSTRVVCIFHARWVILKMSGHY